VNDAFFEWDATLLLNPDAGVAINRGCPPGFIAETVAPGTPMSVVYDPARPAGGWLRCRMVAPTSAGDVAAVQDDATAGGSVADTLGGAIADTLSLSGRPGAATVGGTVSSWASSLPSLNTTVIVVGVLGLVAVIFMLKH
jgi:hypothetical protein